LWQVLRHGLWGERGLDDMEELKFLTLPGLELRPLCPARSSSSYTDCATVAPNGEYTTQFYSAYGISEDKCGTCNCRLTLHGAAVLRKTSGAACTSGTDQICSCWSCSRAIWVTYLVPLQMCPPTVYASVHKWHNGNCTGHNMRQYR
jgi:hypothetical protein